MILDVLLYGMHASHLTDEYNDKHERPLVVLHPRMARGEFVLRLLHNVLSEKDVMHLVMGKQLIP